eukprot:TRINITY_DN37_c0_g2_i21.p3 TRINITY_DN37_c0_g2~~TRINITY_DN37_c0_g2_i21.p3  ORF type:complete len:116 (-),score=6.26 TRINITY_DN37_c0_g2_i21:23-370(-)
MNGGYYLEYTREAKFRYVGYGMHNVYARRRSDWYVMHDGHGISLDVMHEDDANSKILSLYFHVDHGMNYVDVDNDVDIDNDIQNDDMVHVKCVLALSCQANVNTQKPSLKVRQYT